MLLLRKLWPGDDVIDDTAIWAIGLLPPPAAFGDVVVQLPVVNVLLLLLVVVVVVPTRGSVSDES